ncbi:MAG TPA: hypothetical protein VNN74_04520 [Candidatus Micrarchaeia archaeon]|nr:hypothetical protein [Candidatus Micrarchaeia archaeon]
MRSIRARALALATILSLSLGLSGAVQASASNQGGVTPNPTNMLDCNGHSAAYQSVKVDLGGLCTDPIAVWSGDANRFYDNGRYIGHDEPAARFLSHAPGSGNNLTYDLQLSTDPRGAPTTSPRPPITSDMAQLNPAVWFGLALCDPQSYPLNACRPDSDSNGSYIKDPLAAGSAFMELQFYPPGYPPFLDAPSCSSGQWCAALTIDSLEATYGFKYINSSCTEPVNFAFLQRNGIPAGPPSPQLADVSSYTPNSQTLMMNPSDQLQVSITDTAGGVRTTISDLTTGQSGSMTASAANGFMDTNAIDCSGHPFSFHPEFSTASPQNDVPWAASEGGVMLADELGHFQPCSSVSHPFPFSVQYATGQSFVDAGLSQTCVGGFEGRRSGEGPCNTTTANCQQPTTEGGAACPFPNVITSLLPCEFSDAFCMPRGPRPVVANGGFERVSWPVAGCQDNAFQNGDLDFDGSSYVADWPDGNPHHPTSLQYIGPFSHGRAYPQVQFETDVGGSEAFCATVNGRGCTAKPVGAAFYPFWSIGRATHAIGTIQPQGTCAFDFGNRIAGVTLNTLRGDAQYGHPDVRRFGGTLISSPMANPELTTRGCTGPTA